MLRRIVLVIGWSLVAAGILVLLVRHAAGAGVEAVVIGGLILIGTLFEKQRYGERGERPLGPDWVRSSETFIDPGSGRAMVVYEHSRTRERRYVPVDGS